MKETNEKDIFLNESGSYELEKEISTIVVGLKSPEGINRLLIENVSDSCYEDADDENSTAYGALVLHEADCEGFNKAFIMLLQRIGEKDYEVFYFRNIDNVSGIRMSDGRIFCPYIEKICKRSRVDFKEWIKNH